MIHPIRHDMPLPGGQPPNVARPADGGALAGGYRRAAGQTAGPGRAGRPGERPAIRLTSRGALLTMAVLYFPGALAAAALDWNWLAGAAFVAGSAAAARYASQRDLLAVVVSPPLLFLCSLMLARLVTASGHLVASVAEGILLTLAGVAPWLFAGVAVNLVIALPRGLPGCVRELRRDLRGTRAGHPEGRQSRRATPQ